MCRLQIAIGEGFWKQQQQQKSSGAANGLLGSMLPIPTLFLKINISIMQIP